MAVSSDEEANQKSGGDVSGTPKEVAKSNIELQAIPKADDQPITTDSEADTGGLAGVERIEATAQVWTKWWLIAAYIL